MKKLAYTLIVLLALTMFSCKARTVYVPIENTQKEREYIDRWSSDSIYLHDSIYVERKGDTIWLEKYKTFYREKIVRDSIFITDSVKISVPYPVVEVKEVNRLRNWQIVLMCLGGVLIGFVGYRIIRYVKIK